MHPEFKEGMEARKFLAGILATSKTARPDSFWNNGKKGELEIVVLEAMGPKSARLRYEDRAIHLHKSLGKALNVLKHLEKEGYINWGPYHMGDDVYLIFSQEMKSKTLHMYETMDEAANALAQFEAEGFECWGPDQLDERIYCVFARDPTKNIIH